MSSRFTDAGEQQRLAELQFQFNHQALQGKVVLVAGGAGGLGTCLVALLLSEGAIPVVGYLSNSVRAAQVKAGLEERFGGEVHLIEGDLRQEEAGHRLVEEAAKLTGSIHGMACFVGDPARVPFESLTTGDLSRSCESNFIGPILLAKSVGEHMIAHKVAGSIVLLSSMQGVGIFENSLTYGAPKAAIIHACRILARQWSHCSIQINVVAPGATTAGMAAASVNSGKYDRYLEQGKASRFGRPEDVARAVRFLLEPNSYVTGQLLVVDGGMSI